MTFKARLFQQIRRISLVVFTVWFVYLLVTGLIIGVGKLVYKIPAGDFTREPNATLKAPFYVGLISNLGIMLWAGAAALCFFSFVFLNRNNRDSPFRLFMFHAAWFTTILAFDDVYQWHEEVFPYYLSINQKLVYVVYLGYALFFFLRFRKVIFKTEYVIFLLSIALLSLSVLVDVIEGSEKLNSLLFKISGINLRMIGDYRILFEDTFKGMGILTWLMYFARVCLINVFPTLSNRGEYFTETIIK